MSQEPQGLKTQKNVKCPHCSQAFPIRIIIYGASMAIGIPTIDRKGAFKPQRAIPGFKARTVA